MEIGLDGQRALMIGANSGRGEASALPLSFVDGGRADCPDFSHGG